MGYSLQTHIRHSPVPSKTHTPDWQLSESGLRFYSPILSRWLSRDPLELKWMGALRRWREIGLVHLRLRPPTDLQNLYSFVLSDPCNRIDAFGEAAGPREGDACCEKPCEITAKTKHVSCTPVRCRGGGCSRGAVIGFDIDAEIQITVVSGSCPTFTCDYWNCNERVGNPRDRIPRRWPASCNSPGYTYRLRGDPDEYPGDNSHAKAVGGRVWYLSCEGRTWQKKGPIDASGTLSYAIKYDPPDCEP